MVEDVKKATPCMPVYPSIPQAHPARMATNTCVNKDACILFSTDFLERNISGFMSILFAVAEDCADAISIVVYFVLNVLSNGFAMDFLSRFPMEFSRSDWRKCSIEIKSA